jgi:glucose uptake protein
VIFNFANMLLIAAVSVAGLSVAFPVGIGTAVIIGSLLNLVIRRTGNPMLLVGGCALLILALVVDSLAYGALLVRRHEALARAGKAKSTRRPTPAKGLILSVVSGLLMASFAPLLQHGMDGELGLGPYTIMAVFAVGVFFSTFAFNMFFVNLAVEGDPVEIGDYFKARPARHLLGLSGGAIWTMGAVAVLVAAAAPPAAQVGPAAGYFMGQCFAVIAALWGLLVWKEFRGADGKTKLGSMLTLLLYLGGLLVISLAPLYVRQG